MMQGSRSAARLAATIVLAAVSLTGFDAAGEPAFVGLQVQGMTDDIAESLGLSEAEGILVRDVAFGGPAALAGTLRGDIIIEFNGDKVEDLNGLVGAMARIEAGNDVEMVVLRNGESVTLTMETLAKPEAWQIETGAFAVLPSVGLTLAALTDRMRQRYSLRWSSVGVVVSGIDREVLSAPGLREGDVLLQVNQNLVWHPEQVADLLNEAKEAGKDRMLLLVESVDGFRFLLLPVK